MWPIGKCTGSRVDWQPSHMHRKIAVIGPMFSSVSVIVTRRTVRFSFFSIFFRLYFLSFAIPLIRFSGPSASLPWSWLHWVHSDAQLYVWAQFVRHRLSGTSWLDELRCLDRWDFDQHGRTASVESRFSLFFAFLSSMPRAFSFFGGVCQLLVIKIPNSIVINKSRVT